jgi:hypothetical protein
VLDRLVELYECDVADLLAGWGEHRTVTDRRQTNMHDPEPAVLALRVDLTAEPAPGGHFWSAREAPEARA